MKYSSNYKIYLKFHPFFPHNIFYICGHCSKINPDWGYEIIHNPYPQPVDIYTHEFCEGKDIFVYRLTIR